MAPHQRCYVGFPSRLIGKGGLACGGPSYQDTPLSLDLVVLLISESDLRSALTARLTMVGINVVTIGVDQLAQGMPEATIMTAALVTNSGRSAWFVGVLVVNVYLAFAMTLYLLPPTVQ